MDGPLGGDMRARPPVLTLAVAVAAIAAGAMMSAPASAATPLVAAHTAVTTNVAPTIVQHPTARACDAVAKPGQMTCMAIRRTDVKGVKANAMAPNATPSGITPANL